MHKPMLEHHFSKSLTDLQNVDQIFLNYLINEREPWRNSWSYHMWPRSHRFELRILKIQRKDCLLYSLNPHRDRAILCAGALWVCGTMVPLVLLISHIWNGTNCMRQPKCSSLTPSTSLTYVAVSKISQRIQWSYKTTYTLSTPIVDHCTSDYNEAHKHELTNVESSCKLIPSFWMVFTSFT